MRKIANRILTFSAALVALYSLSPALEEVRDIVKEVNHEVEIFEIKKSEGRVDHSKYINEDYIGFLIIEDTNIYYPIVQGEDNDFYLTHDWNGKSDRLGGIFMDYRNSLEDNVMTLYGHYTMENNRFSQLEKFVDEDFLPKMFISFKDGREVKLSPFAFSIIGLEDMMQYKDSYSTYEEFKRISIRSFDSEYNNENILLLSTCASPTTRYVLSTLVIER